MLDSGGGGGGGGLICVYLINAGLCSVERGVGGFHAYFNYAGLCSVGGGGGGHLCIHLINQHFVLHNLLSFCLLPSSVVSTLLLAYRNTPCPSPFLSSILHLSQFFLIIQY